MKAKVKAKVAPTVKPKAAPVKTIKCYPQVHPAGTAVLNLGAGNKVIAGASVVNHDRLAHRPEINCVWDLNILPWPWRDNAFELVVACAVLEHLRITLLESMGECWRVLRPGGVVRVKVPFWNSDNTYSDPTHYWAFSPAVFDMFDPATKHGAQYKFYKGWRPWKIVKPAALNPSKTSIVATLQVIK